MHPCHTTPRHALCRTRMAARPPAPASQLLPLAYVQAFEASAEVCKTVTQKMGAVLPTAVEKPALELVKITKDMKVRSCTQHSAFAITAFPSAYALTNHTSHTLLAWHICIAIAEACNPSLCRRMCCACTLTAPVAPSRPVAFSGTAASTFQQWHTLPSVAGSCTSCMRALHCMMPCHQCAPPRCWLLQDVAVYKKLRVERMNARLVGVRAKKAKEAAKEAESAQ